MVGRARKNENSVARPPVEPGDQAGEYGGPRARHPRHERQHLPASDAERLTERDLLEVVQSAAPPRAIQHQDQDAARDEAGSHRLGPEEVLLDPVVEQESDDGRGQEGDEHAQDESLRGAARPETFDGEVGERPPVLPRQRQDRAELDEISKAGLPKSSRRDATIRWPVEETGMNSVRPSTTPITAAFSRSTHARGRGAYADPAVEHKPAGRDAQRRC